MLRLLIMLLIMATNALAGTLNVVNRSATDLGSCSVHLYSTNGEISNTASLGVGQSTSIVINSEDADFKKFIFNCTSGYTQDLNKEHFFDLIDSFGKKTLSYPSRLVNGYVYILDGHDNELPLVYKTVAVSDGVAHQSRDDSKFLYYHSNMATATKGDLTIYNDSGWDMRDCDMSINNGTTLHYTSLAAYSSVKASIPQPKSSFSRLVLSCKLSLDSGVIDKQDLNTDHFFSIGYNGLNYPGNDSKGCVYILPPEIANGNYVFPLRYSSGSVGSNECYYQSRDFSKKLV